MICYYLVKLVVYLTITVIAASFLRSIGPGCTQGDVDHATHIYGLAVPAGIFSTTGIAGLTLGGGTGYLTRNHGLTTSFDARLAHGPLPSASGG